MSQRPALPHARETVRGRLAGVVWQGRVLRGSDRLPPEELKYLWHAVVNGEWPVRTTQAEYVASLRSVILDPATAIFVGLRQGTLQGSFVRRSRPLQGPRGKHWPL